MCELERKCRVGKVKKHSMGYLQTYCIFKLHLSPKKNLSLLIFQPEHRNGKNCSNNDCDNNFCRRFVEYGAGFGILIQKIGMFFNFGLSTRNMKNQKLWQSDEHWCYVKFSDNAKGWERCDVPKCRCDKCEQETATRTTTPTKASTTNTDNNRL